MSTETSELIAPTTPKKDWGLTKRPYTLDDFKHAITSFAVSLFFCAISFWVHDSGFIVLGTSAWSIIWGVGLYFFIHSIWAAWYARHSVREEWEKDQRAFVIEKRVWENYALIPYLSHKYNGFIYWTSNDSPVAPDAYPEMHLNSEERMTKVRIVGVESIPSENFSGDNYAINGEITLDEVVDAEKGIFRPLTPAVSSESE